VNFYYEFLYLPKRLACRNEVKAGVKAGSSFF